MHCVQEFLYFYMFPCSHENRVYVQRDIHVLVGSPTVWEHPRAHALKCPPLGEPIHTRTSPSTNAIGRMGAAR